MRKIALVLAVLCTLTGAVIARPVMPRQPPVQPPTLEAIAVSPDGKTIATCYHNPFGGIDLINAKNGRGLGVILQFANADSMFRPTGMALSPNGNRLAAIGALNRIAVWETSKSGAESLTFKAYEDEKLNTRHSPECAASIVFSEDNKTLITITNDGSLRRWDADNGKLLKSFSLGSARAAALNVDGKFAASAHVNGMVHVWNTETSDCIKSLQLSKLAEVRGIALSRDGKRIVATVDNEPVPVRRVSNLFRTEYEKVAKTIVFDVQTGERLFEMRSTFADVQFSPTGKSIITCDGSGPIRIYEVATGKLFRTMPKDTAGCYEVIPFADGTHVACRWPSGISVWNMTTSERVMGK